MPRHLLWWGGVALTLGGVVFCLATTGRLAGQFNAVHYTTVQKVTTHFTTPMCRGDNTVHYTIVQRVTSPPMGEVTRGA